MQVRVSSGHTITTQIPSPEFWGKLEQGAPVTIETWRGQVMRLRALERDEPTSDNPAWRFGNARAGSLAVAAMTVVMAAMILVALRFGRVRRRM
jgi:hypothetical protein